MYCKVTIIGNLGKDPEVRFTKTGMAVANVSIATKRSNKADTQWHNVTFFASLAEIVQKYLKKGMKVLVEGTIEYQTYQASNGETKYRTVIIADEMRMLDFKVEAAGEYPLDKKPEAPAKAFQPTGASLGGDPLFDEDLPF